MTNTRQTRKAKRELTRLIEAIQLEHLQDAHVQAAILGAVERLKHAEHAAQHPSSEQLDMFPGADFRAWMENRITPSLPGFGKLLD